MNENMLTKIIDLSVEIEDGSVSEEVMPKINYINHKKGAVYLGLGLLWKGDNFIKKIWNTLTCIFSGRVLTPKDFKDNIGLSTELIKLSTHTGTHVDAPYHYGPQNKDISSLPLEIFFNDAVVLDFSTRNSELSISKKEITRKLKDIEYTLKRNDIVILRTGADKYWGSKYYTVKYVGLSVEGLDFLLDSGVQVIGTDCFGLDQPFQWMHKKYIESKDNNYLWPTHIHGRERPYFMIEKMANLEKLDKQFGFKVAAFPIKIKNASAAWSRVVAIFEK